MLHKKRVRKILSILHLMTILSHDTEITLCKSGTTVLIVNCTNCLCIIHISIPWFLEGEINWVNHFYYKYYSRKHYFFFFKTASYLKFC